jgi:hypothetical protein
VTALQENELVYLADRAIRLRVVEPDHEGAVAEVEVGGTFSPHCRYSQGEELQLKTPRSTHATQPTQVSRARARLSHLKVMIL